MQNEITYILGAGASFNSIPVVKTFGDRLGEFYDSLKHELGQGSYTTGQKGKLETLINCVKDFISDVKSHQSFDTYFKKIFHLGQTQNINRAKKILNLYFLWEHLADENYNSVNTQNFIKNARVDKRYDALIAGLLSPLSGQTKTLCSVTFISWNYDLNLLLSLKNFYDPDISIKKFIEKKMYGDKIWKIDDRVTVLNMNGYFYNKRLGDLSKVDIGINQNQKSIQFILDTIDSDYFNISPCEDADLINFAWDGKNNDVIESAKRAVSNSSEITVVGYTFPLYNRIIDIQYFNQDNLLGKYLNFQDPNIMRIKDRIERDFKLYWEFRLKKPQRGQISVDFIEDCTSFHVPSNIY